MTWSKHAAVVVVAVAAALSTVRCADRVRGQTPMSASPDVVFHNGKIATVNANFEIVQAVAVQDRRILAVGSNETVRALATSETRMIDLQGKTVLPGFYDNHVHLWGSAHPVPPDSVDLWAARSLGEVLDGLRKKAATLPKGAWIRAVLPYTTGDTHPFPQDKLPTRWDLDSATPDHPVYMTRGHSVIVNSLALTKAGITKATIAHGGMIVKDARGEVTGQLREGGAHRLVTRVMPPAPKIPPETTRADIKRFLEALIGVGITSANIVGLPLTEPDQWRLVQDFYTNGRGDNLPRLTVQARLSPGHDRFPDVKTAIDTTIRELEATPFRTGFGNDRLKVGAIKMSIDGAHSGPTSWILPPYPTPDYQPGIRIPEEAFYPVAKRGHELGWQLGIHCIGDAAVQMCVNVMDRILKESPRTDARHYIHHYTVLPPEETLRKTADSRIIVASQPNWVFSKMQFAREVVSGHRLETTEPLKSLTDRGIRVSYGSDSMPYGPLVGIHSAVTRKSVDGRVYGPGERVSLQEAIRGYTLETAYMTFDDKHRGSLEVGKLADMVVLSEDIFSVDADRIKDIGVEQTIIGGQVVHKTTTPTKPFHNINHPWWTEPATKSSGRR